MIPSVLFLWCYGALEADLLHITWDCVFPSTIVFLVALLARCPGVLRSGFVMGNVQSGYDGMIPLATVDLMPDNSQCLIYDSIRRD